MKGKRVAALGLCASLLFGNVAAAKEVQVYTDTEEGVEVSVLLDEDDSLWETTDVPADTTALELKGKGMILMDIDTGTVLYEQDSRVHLPIASVTKIMTLLLVMEAIDDGLLAYTDVLTCSPTAASMGGSQIWLEPEETMTVDDLLKAAAVVSANDACAMLAEHIAGSIEGFVARMNTRANELGMMDTNFLDCSGLNDDAYSCAYDVALMSCELMRNHPDITKYTTIWMDTLRDGKSQLVNTNKLVRHYSGATGLKTGTTSVAGHNLSATATRDGLSLCAVMLGCETTDDRFGGCRKLLDYGFANYTLYTPTVDPAAFAPIPVLHGVEEQVELIFDTPQPLLLKKGQESAVKFEITLAEDLEAPVEPKQIVGDMQFLLNGEVLSSYPVRAVGSVPRLTLWRALYTLLLSLIA